MDDKDKKESKDSIEYVAANQEFVVIPYLDICGHALFLGWFLFAIWGFTVNDSNGISDMDLHLYKLLFFGTILVVVLLLWLFKKSVAKHFNALIRAVVAGVLTVLWGIAPLITANATILAVTWILAGAGQILLASLWRERLLLLEWRQVAVVILGSFIFATGTLITISMLPSVLISIILIILSSGSVILFLYVNHRHSFARTKPNAPLNFTVSTFQDESKRPWHRRNSFVVLYTFVTAFFACFVTSPDYGIAGILAIAVAVFLAALLQIYVIVRAQIDFSRLLPILFLPLTAISVFGLCFTDDSMISLVFVALIFFLFACYEMLNASAMYMGHDAYINSGLVAFIIDQTSSAIGLFFGWLFGLIVFYFFDWTPTATIALCFSVVLVCAIVNIFLFNKIHYLTGYLDDDPANLYRSAHIPDDYYLELPATSGDTGISGKGRFRVQCERVVKHYALSPRQADVFFLLARGHSSQHIQKELFISYHTVKSHKYSIYSKLGIHTHQELIDLVDHHES